MSEQQPGYGPPEIQARIGELRNVEHDLRAHLERFRIERGVPVETFAAMVLFEGSMYQQTVAFSNQAFHEYRMKMEKQHET